MRSGERKIIKLFQATTEDSTRVSFFCFTDKNFFNGDNGSRVSFITLLEIKMEATMRRGKKLLINYYESCRNRCAEDYLHKLCDFTELFMLDVL
jgi:hypothetical protein